MSEMIPANTLICAGVLAKRAVDRQRAKEYYEAHKEERKAYRKANRERISKRMQAYNKSNKASILTSNRRYRIGVEPTRPEPETCELCGEMPGKRSLHLDHCHANRVFRGWLCSRCNTGLGQFRDNAELLRKAADYVGGNL